MMKIFFSFFEKAITVYPQNAEAHRWLACCLNSGWLFDFKRQDIESGLLVAARAVELDPTSASCHAARGFCQLWTDGLQAAGESYRKALALNPDDPNVLAEMALFNIYSGNLAEAYELFVQAFRLNPLPPLWYAEFRAIAIFVEGRYAEALPAFAAVPDGAWDVMYAMACLGHLGKHELAAECKTRYEANGRTWDLLKGARGEPYVNPESRERLITGIEKALAF